MSLGRIFLQATQIIKNHKNLSPLSDNLGILSSGMNNLPSTLVEVSQVFILKGKKCKMVDIFKMKGEIKENEE